MPKPADARNDGTADRPAWMGARRGRIGDVATIVILLLILLPFFWLVQMSFRPN